MNTIDNLGRVFFGSNSSRQTSTSQILEDEDGHIIVEPDKSQQKMEKANFSIENVFKMYNSTDLEINQKLMNAVTTSMHETLQKGTIRDIENFVNDVSNKHQLNLSDKDKHNLTTILKGIAGSYGSMEQLSSSDLSANIIKKKQRKTFPTKSYKW